MIIVEPDIGEKARLLSYPFQDKNLGTIYGNWFVKSIKDKIDNISKGQFLIANKWYSLFRISHFTFGGIWMMNKEWNLKKIYQSDIKILQKQGIDTKGIDTKGINFNIIY